MVSPLVRTMAYMALGSASLTTPSTVRLSPGFRPPPIDDTRCSWDVTGYCISACMENL